MSMTLPAPSMSSRVTRFEPVRVNTPLPFLSRLMGENPLVLMLPSTRIAPAPLKASVLVPVVPPLFGTTTSPSTVSV